MKTKLDNKENNITKEDGLDQSLINSEKVDKDSSTDSMSQQDENVSKSKVGDKDSKSVTVDESPDSEKISIGKIEQDDNSSDQKADVNAKSDAVRVTEDIVDDHLNFIIGKKIGMTQIFDEDGSSYPVSVISVEPNTVTQIKTISRDGYDSIQLGYKVVSEKNKSKPYIGKFKASNLPVKSVLKEFRVQTSLAKLIKVGSKVTVNVFSVGDIVDVSGVSKGKGFAGVMKRHGFGGGRRSHGKNSVMRKPGAIGASADPGRVWPGKAMAGRMGGEKVTIKKLSILRIDSKMNRLFVNGSVPGANNGVVYIKS